MAEAGAGEAAGKVAASGLPRSRDVLLLVDFISPLDFPGAEELTPHARAAAQATARLRRRLDGEQVQCIYANDNYGSWHDDFKDLWARCGAMRGPAGEIANRLKPRKRDCTILKPRHSAFYATPLDLLLRELGCKRLIVTGVAADSCVLFSAMDAYLRGYKVWVPQDCIAAEQDDNRIKSLEHMQRVLKADIRPSGESPRARR